LYFKYNTTIYTDLAAGVLTLGAVGDNNVYITSGHLQLRNATTVYTDLAAGSLTIGEVGASKSNVLITAGKIELRNNTTDVIVFDTTESRIDNLLKMSGANAAISIGSTPPTDSSTGTGIWLDRTGMYGLASNVLQAKFDATTGKFTAGAGVVTIGAGGIVIDPGSGAYGSLNAYTFTTAVAQPSFGMYAYTDATMYSLDLDVVSPAAKHAWIGIQATVPTGKLASIQIQATETAGGMSTVRLTSQEIDIYSAILKIGISAGSIGFFQHAPGAKPTGWTAATGTPTRTTFVTGTVTLSVLAEHVKALEDDLLSLGLINA
jgi:hypothetical protein